MHSIQGGSSTALPIRTPCPLQTMPPVDLSTARCRDSSANYQTLFQHGVRNCVTCCQGALDGRTGPAAHWPPHLQHQPTAVQPAARVWTGRRSAPGSCISALPQTFACFQGVAAAAVVARLLPVG